MAVFTSRILVKMNTINCVAREREKKSHKEMREHFLHQSGLVHTHAKAIRPLLRKKDISLPFFTFLELRKSALIIFKTVEAYHCLCAKLK